VTPSGSAFGDDVYVLPVKVGRANAGTLSAPQRIELLR